MFNFYQLRAVNKAISEAFTRRDFAEAERITDVAYQKGFDAYMTQRQKKSPSQIEIEILQLEYLAKWGQIIRKHSPLIQKNYKEEA